MDNKALEKLKYPVGLYEPNKNPTDSEKACWINVIASFPDKVHTLVGDISNEQLNWKYRPEGWSVRQVIHHCVDSHMNALIRFKLALTEDCPTIRPYFEDRWARLIDHEADVSGSLNILRDLHDKWCIILNALTAEDLKREFIHPQYGQKFNLAETIGNYAWHCRHHLAHIKNGLYSEGKYNEGS